MRVTAILHRTLVDGNELVIKMNQGPDEKQDELKQFESDLESDVDFAFWGLASYWHPEEAATLLLGKDPAVITWDKIQQYSNNSEFARRHAVLRDLLCRAQHQEHLSDPSSPADILRWAEERKFDVPERLLELFELRSAPEIPTAAPAMPAAAQGMQDTKDDELKESDYWQGLRAKAVEATRRYPEWRKTVNRVYKTKNLHYWIRTTIGVDEREAAILKNVLKDLFEELR